MENKEVQTHKLPGTSLALPYYEMPNGSRLYTRVVDDV